MGIRLSIQTSICPETIFDNPEYSKNTSDCRAAQCIATLLGAPNLNISSHQSGCFSLASSRPFLHHLRTVLLKAIRSNSPCTTSSVSILHSPIMQTTTPLPQLLQCHLPLRLHSIDYDHHQIYQMCSRTPIANHRMIHPYHPNSKNLTPPSPDFLIPLPQKSTFTPRFFHPTHNPKTQFQNPTPPNPPFLIPLPLSVPLYSAPFLIPLPLSVPLYSGSQEFRRNKAHKARNPPL